MPPKKKKRSRTTPSLHPNTEVFRQKSEYDFQRICQEAFSHEPDIESCSIYGVQGEGQHGIDLIAFCRTGNRTEVVQCRRYRVFQEEDVLEASREFLKAKKHWKKLNVRRFVLMTSADTSAKAVQDAIHAEKQKFGKLGLKYVAWGCAELCTRLRPQRSAVQQIYGTDGADRICGPVRQTQEMRAAQQFIDYHLGNIAIELEKDRSDKLEALREASREGRHAEALAGAVAIKSSAASPAFKDELKARFLRFEAAMRLNLNEPAAEAENLVIEAKRLDSHGDYQVIDAYLAYRMKGVDAGINSLAKPTTVDAWNTRWSMMIEARRTRDVQVEHGQQGASFAANAETHRLLALSKLLEGDLPGAQAGIARAVSARPRHHGIRMAAAIIDYRSCLATDADSGPNLNWPAPVDWAFVKRDPDTLARLQRAASAFHALKADASTDRERALLETWEFACLACDATRTEEASAFARSNLERDPAQFRIVAWAVQRNTEFDRQKVAAALEGAISSNDDIDLDAHLALCALYASGGEHKAAERVLDRAESSFRSRGNGDLWAAQKAQFVARRGKSTAALIASIGDAKLREFARLSSLRAGRGRKSDLKCIGESLANEYERTGSAHLLFQAADTLYRAGLPDFAADHARELVEKVGTDLALRLAVHSAFTAKKYDRCLELLSQNRHLLQGGLLSPELRNLQAACQEKLGEWPEAIKQAESLYRDKPDATSFQNFFGILVQSGDTARASVLARDLLNLPKAGLALLLRVAHFARLHDINLAKELWRKAAAMPLKKMADLAGVVGLAFELGVENEAAALQQKLFSRAGQKKGPIQRKTFAEIVAMVERARKNQQKLSASYDRSEAPIHIIAAQAGATLAQIFHQRLGDNRKATNLTAVPALLARYGGRSLPEKYKPAPLYADVTALHLAADCELLPLIEQHLGPLSIAPELTLSLVEQISRCRPHQPTQHVWRDEVIKLVASGHLHPTERKSANAVPGDHAFAEMDGEWLGSWQTAQAQGALLAVDWPLTNHKHDRVVAIPDSLAPGFANLRELLHAAASAGVLPQEEIAKHVGATGVFRAYPRRADHELRWPNGRTVVLTGVPLEILANQGVLRAVSSVFKIFIFEDDLKGIRADEEEYQRHEALAAWTQALLERVQRGIEQRNYRVVPQTADARKYQRMALDAQGLGNLLNAVATNKDAVLWCDDRMVNRYAMAGPRPVVGILEVMRMLEARGVMPLSLWSQKLAHLRLSNVRYVPTSSEEILHLLQLAPIHEGRLEETPELAAMRRYYGACLLDRTRLLGPKQISTGQDLQEWNFILRLRHAVDEAFRELWTQKNVPAETKRAQADWVWRSLYVDVIGIRHAVLDKFAPGEEREMSAFLVGSLYSLGIGASYVPENKGDPSPRKLYFEWLEQHLLRPLEHSNPGFTDLVAAVIAKDVERSTRAASAEPNDKQRKAHLFLTARLFVDLPEEIIQKCILPADVLAALKLNPHPPSIKVDGVVFDLEALSEAQAQAFAGQPATVKDRTKKIEWTLQRDETAQGPTLTLIKSTGERKKWSEPMFGLLLGDLTARIAHLEKLRHWFDCDDTTRRNAMQAVASAERPHERILRAQDWMLAAPEVGYRELERMLRHEEEVDFDQIRPADWRRLLQHLRFREPTEASPQEELAAAATMLQAEEGLPTALRRMMALPRRLPSVLEDAWKALGPDEAKWLWDKLLHLPRSVIVDLHLVRLVYLRTDVDRTAANHLVSGLFTADKGAAIFDSYLAVLQWTQREMNRWPERHQVPAWLRLVLIWYHANRIHGLFRVGQVNLPELREWFKTHSSSWHHGVMDHETAFVEDVANPHLVGTGQLLLNGLGQLLNDLKAGELDELKIPALWQELRTKDGHFAAKLLLDLCRRTDLAANSLGSFLTASSAETRRRMLGEEWDIGIGLAKGEIAIQELIETARKAPLTLESWTPLMATLGELPVPQESRRAMSELINGLNVDAMVANNAEWSFVVFSFLANQAIGLDPEVKERFEQQIYQLAGGARCKALNPEEANQADMQLLQALLALALVPGDEAASAANYFAKIERMIRVQPTVAELVQRPILFWTVSLPFEQQRGLRALIYLVRAFV